MRLVRILVIVCINYVVVCQSEAPCSIRLSVNISDGIKLRNDQIRKNDVVYTPDTYFQQNGSIFGCICKYKKCLKKCCPHGHVFTGYSCMDNGTDHEVLLYDKEEFIGEPDESNYFIIDKSCDTNWYKLEPEDYLEDLFYLQRDGSLYMPNSNEEELGFENYCLAFEGEYGNMSVMVCSREEEPAQKFFEFGK